MARVSVGVRVGITAAATPLRGDEMARYSRESRMRAIKAEYHPPVLCANCGQSFWSEEQKRAHVGVSNGKSYCQYAPAGSRP